MDLERSIQFGRTDVSERGMACGAEVKARNANLWTDLKT